MEDKNTEVEKLLEESPELQKFMNRLRTIEMLKEDAKTEKDLDMMADSFNIVLRMQDRLYTQILTYYTDKHSRQFERIYDIAEKRLLTCQQLSDTLREERKEGDDLFKNLCFLMMVNPKDTFENVILKGIERKEKIEDASGQSWQWELHFPLLARLKMAWKLVFGSRTEVESLEV